MKGVIIHRSFDEVLADAEVELVVITTPSDTHYTLTRQALEAGKHGMPYHTAPSRTQILTLAVPQFSLTNQLRPTPSKC